MDDVGQRLRRYRPRIPPIPYLLRQAPRIPAALVVVAVLVAALAGLIAPHDPIAPDLSVRQLPPVPLSGSSWEYPLGTDRQGRDVLSRIIVGAQMSILVGFVAIIVSGVIGVTLGLAAGYIGGWVDSTVMRLVDLSLAFPAIVVALVLAVTMGPSYWLVIWVISLLYWGRYARVIRGEALFWKERDFVALARVAGCSTTRIIVWHILPNVSNTIVVLSTLLLGSAILVEASLSFLGAGVPPPTPTWGNMIAEGRDYIVDLWWLSVFPGLAIVATVLSLNLLGDWLRDMLDPKLRQL